MYRKLPSISIKYVVLGGIFLLLFIAFTLSAKFGYLKQFDFDATVKLQNHIPQKIYLLFSLLSLLARFDVLTILLVIYVLFRRTLKNFITLCLFGCAHIVEYVGKLMFDHPGPPFMFYRFKESVYFPDLYVVGSSYPSGHALRAVFIVLLCSFLVIKKVKNPLYKLLLISSMWGIASMLIIGKVALGQHWTSDVIGGILLGVSFGLFAHALP